MELLFCSSNINKTKEIQHKVGETIEIKNLNDLGFLDEIPETANTLKGNALLKTQFGFDKFGKPCFSDDSGLEVEALNNEPGVYSARYAGEPKSDERNMDKLLLNLKGVENRKACFKTVIIYLDERGEKHTFEGKVEGSIIDEKRGEHGFGYDPIFVPNGYDRTFAEMNMDEKSKLSHRAIAVQKFVSFLNSNSQ